MHTVDSLVFEEELIVFGDGNEEEDGGNVLEAMDPLLSLRALSSYIKHAVCKVTNDEGSFGDTSSLDSRSQNVLVVGHVVALRDTLNVIEVAKETQVSDLILKFYCVMRLELRLGHLARLSDDFNCLT